MFTAEQIEALPPAQRIALWEQIRALPEKQALSLRYNWRFWAREKQCIPEGDWDIWLILSGRGWGKTRVGAESTIEFAREKRYRNMGLVGRTAADVRDVIIEGESGILACSPPNFRPRYVPNQRALVWPNGVMAKTYSAEQPKSLRGPQHEYVWADEIAAWQYPESFDNMMLGLRLGPKPRLIATTTPKPTKLILSLVKRENVHVTPGTTYENSNNLARSFMDTIVGMYEGTRLGDQELLGLLLEDNPDAIWTRETIERNRVAEAPENLWKIVVGVDPSGSSRITGAECGIVVAGASAPMGHGYVLEDASLHGKPEDWAKAAIRAYHRWQADAIVAEVNFGGEMVKHTIDSVSGDKSVPVVVVRASRGKRARAEPVSTLYSRGRVRHVGHLAMLESQMTQWSPQETTASPKQKSPDRMDALVWAITHLLVEPAFTDASIVTGPVSTIHDTIRHGLRTGI